ncbi:hypothetical protein Pst134EA_026957 [Puccinia striiformis f. sp. tritici]|nr:hypothetical protein Pst134EA_026957 [Puccinia striiformis f. sp. tritici]KAH9450251.1 hypothetical protein Pst134EA_026957 [Puccinia striiformis f. sp. tritici]KAH9450768.1 hypothetical protein Pst134EB_018283 [Puccinia striiformis f. sp. tritici]
MNRMLIRYSPRHLIHSEQLVGRQINSVTTTESAVSSYQYLSRQFSSLRQGIENGQYTASEAREQFQSISQQASTTITALNNCLQCYPGASSVLSQSASQAYSEMSSLVQISNQRYGQQSGNVIAPLTQLDAPLQQNLNAFSRYGVTPQRIIPPTFLPTLTQAGFGRTAQFASANSVNNRFGSTHFAN